MVSCILIDKNPDERQRVQGFLTSLGISCDACENPEEGIRLCRDGQPDIVIMESSKLPAAKDFLRLVRYQGRNNHRPIVLMYSKKADIEIMSGSILEGAAEFLVSPFDRDLLRFKLEQFGVFQAKAA